MATSSRSCRDHHLLSLADWACVGKRLGLSRRELEIVQGIFDGKKLAQIAADLRLAIGTVKTYSQRLHRKLAIRDQRELMVAVFASLRGRTR